VAGKGASNAGKRQEHPENGKRLAICGMQLLPNPFDPCFNIPTMNQNVKILLFTLKSARFQVHKHITNSVPFDVKILQLTVAPVSSDLV